MPDREIDVVLMRGGTSKGVFVREGDVPPTGERRDEFLLALMGSPDPMQLEGLGGTHSSTSKVMLVAESRRADCDVEYTFAQVGVERALVDYAGNCGNLTAAVAAYAIDEGLVSVPDGDAQIVLFNTNTGRRIRASLRVHGGRAETEGSAINAGVPRSGSPIVTEYLEPAGALTGKLLPTGRARDSVDISGKTIELSVVDVSGAVVIARAEDLGIDADVAPAFVNARPTLLENLEVLRSAAGAMIGIAALGAPRLVLAAPPREHRTGQGRMIASNSHDLIVRAMSMQKMHHACPFTVVQSVAAAALIEGTIAHECASGFVGKEVRIAHPKGIAAAVVDGSFDSDPVTISSVAVMRTARRLLKGRAYVPLPVL